MHRCVWFFKKYGVHVFLIDVRDKKYITVYQVEITPLDNIAHDNLVGNTKDFTNNGA